jgi:y4mF family transcriptional regulator
MELNPGAFVKTKRKDLGLTQQELAYKAGVGLRFLRELERGKATLQMNKVNQVLMLFGAELGVIPLDRQKLISDEES